MITIHLHGSLAQFGETWRLQVRSIGEAIRAIDAQTRSFLKFVTDKSQEGIAYSIRIGATEISNPDNFQQRLHDGCEVHFVPQIIGGSGGEWWQSLLIGIGLVVLTIFAPYIGLGSVMALGAGGSTIGGVLFTAGMALALGGLAQLLSPTPEAIDSKKLASSSISGTVNTVEQGAPVPIAYGELMIGSHIISLGIQSEDAELE